MFDSSGKFDGFISGDCFQLTGIVTVVPPNEVILTDDKRDFPRSSPVDMDWPDSIILSTREVPKNPKVPPITSSSIPVTLIPPKPLTDPSSALVISGDIRSRKLIAFSDPWLAQWSRKNTNLTVVFPINDKRTFFQFGQPYRICVSLFGSVDLSAVTITDVSYDGWLSRDGDAVSTSYTPNLKIGTLVRNWTTWLPTDTMKDEKKHCMSSVFYIGLGGDSAALRKQIDPTDKYPESLGYKLGITPKFGFYAACIQSAPLYFSFNFAHIWFSELPQLRNP